jgi:prepilin-type N-terminal cleavage/methylation domain-containing protein
MLNKKAFTLIELLISISVISIIFISFPKILSIFMDITFKSNYNKENLNRIYSDIKESFLVSKSFIIENGYKLDIYRYDDCMVTYEFKNQENQIIKSIECNNDFEKKERGYIIDNIDFFNVSILVNNSLKIIISSEGENFNREFIFNKL